ncbi:MAG: N-acetyltransferase family protein, partial [Magnetospirillum sp.]|nr:N-acetyltransferase family protein [Magnetospirillum sp.]
MIIRPSTLADVGPAQAIYAHHVLTGTASFELVPPDRDEMARRRALLVDKGLPWLVAEDADGSLLGYAYAGPYRTRPAYDWTLEDSIYIHP